MTRTLAAAVLSVAYLLATLPALCLCEGMHTAAQPTIAEPAVATCCGVSAVSESESPAGPVQCLCAPPVEDQAVEPLAAIVPDSVPDSLVVVDYPAFRVAPRERVQPIDDLHQRLCIWRC